MASAAVAINEETEASKTGGRAQHPRRAEILAKAAVPGADYDAIAAEYGINKTVIWRWRHQEKVKGNPQPKLVPNPLEPRSEREGKAWALFDAGKTAHQARKEMGINGGNAKAMFERWTVRNRKLRQSENLVKAREARAEKMKDPAYRAEQRANNWRNRRAANDEQEQQELPMPQSHTTQVSRPSAPPSRPEPTTEIVRLPQLQQMPASAALGELLQECIEERKTLRSMVDLLQKEQASDRRKLDAYKRLYGEIQL